VISNGETLGNKGLEQLSKRALALRDVAGSGKLSEFDRCPVWRTARFPQIASLESAAAIVRPHTGEVRVASTGERDASHGTRRRSKEPAPSLAS
jgi:hypothetical protein